jgi:small subunit ribosomal protein S6e
MVSFKLVIGLPNGRCVQKEVQEPSAKALLGKQLGQSVNGDELGFAGYEFTITGGSDYCGFPMRKDVMGQARKRILAVEGTGLKKAAKGIRIRKTVCGNTIHPKITQVNLKVTKEGKESLLPPPGENKEEKKAAA